MKYYHPDIHLTIKNGEEKFSFILPRKERVSWGWLNYAIPTTMVIMWMTLISMVIYYGIESEASPLWAGMLSVVIIILFIQGYMFHNWSSPPAHSVVTTVDNEWWEVCQKVKNLGIVSSSMKDDVYDESVNVAQEMLYGGIINNESTPLEVGVFCDEISQHMSKIKSIENTMLNSWEREDL